MAIDVDRAMYAAMERMWRRGSSVLQTEVCDYVRVRQIARAEITHGRVTFGEMWPSLRREAWSADWEVSWDVAQFWVDETVIETLLAARIEEALASRLREPPGPVPNPSCALTLELLEQAVEACSPTVDPLPPLEDLDEGLQCCGRYFAAFAEFMAHRRRHG